MKKKSAESAGTFAVDQRKQLQNSAAASKRGDRALRKKNQLLHAKLTCKGEGTGTVNATSPAASAASASTTSMATPSSCGTEVVEVSTTPTTPTALAPLAAPTPAVSARSKKNKAKREKAQRKAQEAAAAAAVAAATAKANCSASGNGNSGPSMPAAKKKQDKVKQDQRKAVVAPSCAPLATTCASSQATEAFSALSLSSVVSFSSPVVGGRCCTCRQKRRGLAKSSYWSRDDDVLARAVADRLHEEIVQYAQQTKEIVDNMSQHLEHMIENVRRCVTSLWKESQVETFGSYSTGIWLPSSDVDLVILDVKQVHDRHSSVLKLKELAEVLDQQGWVQKTVVLESAKVPVLKLSSTTTSVPIDITFETSSTHSGLLARDLVKKYAQKIPELYPLAVVVKQLLRERGLNDAYTGGLSSYSVVLMIIHFSLLWRHGLQCFEAAAIYASGSVPPVPTASDFACDSSCCSASLCDSVSVKSDVSTSDSQTLSETKSSPVKASKKEELQSEVSNAKVALSPTKAAPSTSTPAPKPKAVAASPTSSYAAIVSRPMGQPKQASTKDETGSTMASPVPFSYADIAAGKVKVKAEKEPAPPAPLSYASVAAAAPRKPTAVSKPSAPRVVVPTSSTSSPTKTLTSMLAASSKPAMPPSSTSDVSSSSDIHSDVASVTSSSADTEDSSSCSNSSVSSASTSESADEDCGKDHPHHHEDASVSLGEHMINLLEFFGVIFDYKKNGLSIRNGGYIYRLDQSVATANGHLVRPELVIEDPIHPDRNVSACSFAFAKVVGVFEDSFYALKYFRPTRFKPSALSCLLSSVEPRASPAPSNAVGA